MIEREEGLVLRKARRSISMTCHPCHRSLPWLRFDGMQNLRKIEISETSFARKISKLYYINAWIIWSLLKPHTKASSRRHQEDALSKAGSATALAEDRPVPSTDHFKDIMRLTMIPIAIYSHIHSPAQCKVLIYFNQGHKAHMKMIENIWKPLNVWFR